MKSMLGVWVSDEKESRCSLRVFVVEKAILALFACDVHALVGLQLLRNIVLESCLEETMIFSIPSSWFDCCCGSFALFLALGVKTRLA